ncbi:MAG TPA: cytochrome P450 [Nannocystis exedens]|nr:cytochrome P450 [Nannocystis exedens]
MKLNLSAPAVRRDPYPTYAYLRKYEPLIAVKRRFVGRVWYLSRYEDVATALRDPRLVSRRSSVGDGKGWPWWMPRSFRPFVESLVTSDGDDHRRLRALVQVAFTPRRIADLQTQVETVIANQIDVLASKGARGPVDLIEDFALPVPLAIISNMMGVRQEQQLAFHRLTNHFVELAEHGVAGLFIGARNTRKLILFLREQVAEKRANPGDDLISALLVAEADGERLTVEEVAAMIFLLLLAGHETTVNLIGSGTLALLDNPSQFELLREDPTLAELAVEELLRFTNPVEQASPRYAKEPIELYDRVIRRGEIVVLVLASANRDPEVFNRADELDITRTPNRHLAFGHGVHYCLGAPLARMEGRIAVNALLARFPGVRLAVPRDRIEWRRSTLLRGTKRLPVLVA